MHWCSNSRSWVCCNVADLLISRYLFRDGVLIDEGSSLRTFDEVSLKHDFMLCRGYKGAACTEFVWMAYRMVWFDPGWGWQSQPSRVAKELRTLLLLQKS